MDTNTKTIQKKAAMTALACGVGFLSLLAGYNFALKDIPLVLFDVFGIACCLIVLLLGIWKSGELV